MSNLQLDHLNIPARDPEGLARWYAETFDPEDVCLEIYCKAES
jgi:hypothetical protein